MKKRRRNPKLPFLGLVRKTQHIHFLVHGHSSCSTSVYTLWGPQGLWKLHFFINLTMEVWPLKKYHMTSDNFMVHDRYLLCQPLKDSWNIPGMKKIICLFHLTCTCKWINLSSIYIPMTRNSFEKFEGPFYAQPICLWRTRCPFIIEIQCGQASKCFRQSESQHAILTKKKILESLTDVCESFARFLSNRCRFLTGCCYIISTFLCYIEAHVYTKKKVCHDDALVCTLD